MDNNWVGKTNIIMHMKKVCLPSNSKLRNIFTKFKHSIKLLLKYRNVKAFVSSGTFYGNYYCIILIFFDVSLLVKHLKMPYLSKNSKEIEEKKQKYMIFFIRIQLPYSTNMYWKTSCIKSEGKNKNENVSSYQRWKYL